jgi:hypothetical protein
MRRAKRRASSRLARPQIKRSPQGERHYFDQFLQFLFRDLHVATVAQERMQNMRSGAGINVATLCARRRVGGQVVMAEAVKTLKMST